jgi:asparagine synthase (glutamine-hydrolysing)
MSGICGIINLDGRPVAPESLDAMMQAMAYWGPDGSGVWWHGQVGLGHLLLYNTPESVHERLPYRDEAADLTITARARLDNREELADALGIPHPERQEMPDSSIILKAYQKWGEDCPNRLLGDWCFAIWDGRRRRLFIARDHCGNTGLYYHQSDGAFSFASSLKGLLALPETSRRLNELRLAQILVSWPEQGAPTCYQDIFRLPPAHALTVGPQWIKVWQYWCLEDTPRLRLGSDQEYLEAFLDLYTQAVRCRLRSLRPVGVTLSGGLDSGSVAALAARELREQGKVLPAFSSVPQFNSNGAVAPQRFGDETPFIEATSCHAGNIENIYIRAEEVSPLNGIEQGLQLHDEPGHAAVNYYWLVALLHEAKSRGIGTLLTGQGGNATVSWSGQGYLASLARTGQWRTLHQELLNYRAIRRRPWWRIVAGQMIKPLLPPYWPFQYRVLKLGREPWAGYSAIHPDFARRLSLADRMLTGGHDPTFAPKADSRKARHDIIMPGRGILGALWQEMGAGFGLEARDPTLDKRLLEFCLAIPDEQYAKGGLDRRLIRLAMKDLMPPQVLGNTRRGLQAADIGWRLRDSWQEISQALDKVEDSPTAREYLNVHKMRAILASLKIAVTRSNTEQTGTILLRGLMAGLFLLNNDFTPK